MYAPDSIAQTILRLKQDTNTYGTSPLLNEIDCGLVQCFERLSHTDPYAKELCKRMRANLPDGIQDLDRIRQLYNSFAEGRIYYDLRDRGIELERVPEAVTKTPDFTISWKGVVLHAEVKSLSMEGGDSKYAAIMEDGLESRIDMDEQLKRGDRVATSEQVISPIGKQGETPVPYSLRRIIEALIDKLRGLIKPGQLKRGMTILVCDVSQFNLGCTHSESLLPTFKDTDSDTSGSGTLFAVGFGTQGQQVFRPAEFAGLPVGSDHDGTLSQSGIFKEFPAIDGLIFRSGWSPPEYLGLVTARASQSVREVVIAACNHWNDESNSNMAHLTKP